MTRQPTDKQIQTGYAVAKERYGMYGVDTDKVIKALGAISISLHCWQGDDVAGFMNDGGNLGGVLPTGNYLGRARTADELRADLEKVLSLLPGKHRINLHSMYAETGGKHVERDELKPEHFVNWAEWAKRKGLGMDFNPSFFSHPKASSGFTLASYDEDIRKYWIGHSIACRKIGEYFGKTLGTPCVTNIWIPDGYKDTPVDRSTPRKLLKDSLDQIFAEKINPKYNLDAVEPKLFGIGSESYVVGSSEFYLGYAAKNGVLLCLDSGHYHPTETISDKLSAVLATVPEVLLHVSRGVRWDSDHVVLLNDDLQAIAQELVRGNFLDRVHIGLDYFDASINRISAWVTGARNMQKALLLSLLEPLDEMKQLETSGDFTGRMALMEEIKSLPYGPVWDTFCMQQEVPVSYIDSIRQHEKEVLVKRS